MGWQVRQEMAAALVCQTEDQAALMALVPTVVSEGREVMVDLLMAVTVGSQAPVMGALHQAA